MSFNIVDMVKDQVSDQVVGSLGGLLGGNADQSSSAISAAIPGLLSGLMNTASDEKGAAGLVDALNKTDDGLLDNIGGMLSGDKQSSLISQGSSMLSSVLGDGALGSLTSAISGFSGAGKGGIASMLGMLSPMILGLIKRQLMGSGGLNTSSLMSMFSGQKDNINAALPSGFADKLNFSSVSGAVNEAKSYANDTVNEAKSVAQDAVQHTEEAGGSILGKLLPLALLAGAAYLAYNMFLGNKGAVEEHATTAVEHATADVNVADLGKNLTGTMGSLVSGFSSITDADSATAALPNIEAATGDLGKYAGMLDKLPEGARGQITSLLGDNISKLTGIVEKVSAIPGVGPIIKPLAEGLLSKLALFK